MHASSLAAWSLLPSVASQASVQNETAVLGTSANPSLYGRAPKYTPKANTRGGGGSTTRSAFATTATDVVTTSTSVEPTPTSSHPQSTTTGTAYATSAARILCEASLRTPSGCQSRNNLRSRARSVVTDFNAAKAGQVMIELADLSSCGSDGSFDSVDAGQKSHLRKAGIALKNYDFFAVSAVQSTLEQCKVQPSDGNRSQSGSELSAAAVSMIFALAALV